jgi:hypothetical protein
MNSARRLKLLQDDYKTLHFFWNKLYQRTYSCLVFIETESGREQRQEIEIKLFEVKKLIEAAMGPKIGEAVMTKIRMGDK